MDCNYNVILETTTDSSGSSCRPSAESDSAVLSTAIELKMEAEIQMRFQPEVFRKYPYGRMEWPAASFLESLNPERLLDEFRMMRKQTWKTDFNKFLENRHILPIMDKDVMQVARMYENRKSAFVHLALYDPSDLSYAEQCFLRKMEKSYPFGISISFNWCLTVMKHSKLSLVEVCNQFFTSYYGHDDPWSAEICLLMSKTGTDNVYFINLINRIDACKDNKFRVLSPDTVCCYCLWEDSHFADECHIYDTQEKKNRKLEGYCSNCVMGAQCALGLHDQKPLYCYKCDAYGHENEMCKHSDSVAKNKQSVERLRIVAAATQGWNDHMWLSLALDLIEWSDANLEHPNAWKYQLLKEHRSYTLLYPRSGLTWSEGRIPRYKE